MHPRPSVILASTANITSPVIEAYSRSLRLVFISAIVIFFIVNVLVFSIELPRLKKKDAGSENGGEDEN